MPYGVGTYGIGAYGVDGPLVRDVGARASAAVSLRAAAVDVHVRPRVAAGRIVVKQRNGRITVSPG